MGRLLGLCHLLATQLSTKQATLHGQRTLCRLCSPSPLVSASASGSQTCSQQDVHCGSAGCLSVCSHCLRRGDQLRGRPSPQTLASTTDSQVDHPACIHSSTNLTARWQTACRLKEMSKLLLSARNSCTDAAQPRVHTAAEVMQTDGLC